MQEKKLSKLSEPRMLTSKWRQNLHNSISKLEQILMKLFSLVGEKKIHKSFTFDSATRMKFGTKAEAEIVKQ